MNKIVNGDGNEGGGVDRVGEVSVKLPVRVSIVLLILFIVVSIIYYRSDDKLRGPLEFFVIAASATAGICTAIYFGRNAKANLEIRTRELEQRKEELKQRKLELESHKEEKRLDRELLQQLDNNKNKLQIDLQRERNKLEIENIKNKESLQLISRWSDITSKHLNKNTLDLIKAVESEKVDRIGLIKEKFQQDAELKQSIISIINFLEEIAVKIEKDEVKKEILIDYYGNVIKRYYNLFSTWIQDSRQRAREHREKGADKYFRFLEELSRELDNA